MQLPSVTVGRLPRVPAWRLAAAAGAVLLALASVLSQRAEAPAAIAPRSLAGDVAPSAFAARIPHAWLGAAPPRLVAGDRLDVMASRAGDRAAGIGVVVDARVLEVDGDALTVELAPDDAAAIVATRANGYLLFVVLRPRR